MSRKEGELLQKWAKDKGITTTELADIINTDRTNMYHLYKKDVLPNSYKNILKGHGFDVESVEKASVSTSSADDTIAALKSKIETMQLKIDHRDTVIEMLTDELNYFKSVLRPQMQKIPEKKKSNKKNT